MKVRTGFLAAALAASATLNVLSCREMSDATVLMSRLANVTRDLVNENYRLRGEVKRAGDHEAQSNAVLESALQTCDPAIAAADLIDLGVARPGERVCGRSNRVQLCLTVLPEKRR